MQLNKFLAHAGVCSRRHAVNYILEGMVTINNRPVLEPGYRVLEADVVKVQGKIVRPEELVYIVMNKPRDCVTTLSDELGRTTVLHLIKIKDKQRLYPVGRLDKDTTGILLLTNDGDLAFKLSHPRSQIEKVYHIRLKTEVTHEDIQRIRRGLILEDGKAQVDYIGYMINTPKNVVEIRLHSGKNRIVRRIFEHLGYVVARLERVKYAGLSLSNLTRGSWRPMMKKEVELLKRVATRSIKEKGQGLVQRTENNNDERD